MRVGLFLVSPQWPGQDHGAVLRETVRVAVLADTLGFDAVWLAEHHFMSYGVCPSAVTLAGHLLGVTRRITVGTAVSVLPATHPVALAEQAGLLDQVSAGRFALGVGRGGPWRELAVFGGHGRREHGLGGDLDALLSALRDGRAEGTGELLPFPEVPIVPRPATPGGPPVLVAATTGPTVRLAAVRGLPLLLGMHADDEERAAAVASWNAAARDPGPPDPVGPGPAAPDPAAPDSADPDVVAPGPLAGGPGGPGHVAVGIAHVAGSRAQAVREVRETLPRWLGPGLAGYVRADGEPSAPRDPDAYTDLLCRLHPLGTPDDCAARLEETSAATGIDRVALMVQTTPDPARTTETLHGLAGILPRLR